MEKPIKELCDHRFRTAAKEYPAQKVKGARPSLAEPQLYDDIFSALMRPLVYGRKTAQTGSDPNRVAARSACTLLLTCSF